MFFVKGVNNDEPKMTANEKNAQEPFSVAACEYKCVRLFASVRLRSDVYMFLASFQING